MALSQQLKSIADKVRGTTQQQTAVGQSQVGAQAGQAIAQTAQAGPKGKATAQQLAGGITAAQQEVQTKGLAQETQQLGQLGQQAVQQKAGIQQQQLGQQQLINEGQIAELQRSGQLRQNSKALESSKKLQSKELGMQKRLTSAKMEYDGTLSFLTRQQREDLAKLGANTKQMVFDQRLTFQKDEAGRRFSNMRQLADYSLASYKTDQQLNRRMVHMQQAASREVTALQAAHNMVISRMEMEFKRAEKTKDYALLRDLQEKKNALDEKIRRKAANGAMISNVIVGTAMIATAVYTGGNPAAILAAKGLAEAGTGAAQSQGVY